MKLARKIHNIFFAVAFIYLVMCPWAHQLVDIVRHDVTLKTGVTLQESSFKKNFPGTSLTFSWHIQTPVFGQIKTFSAVQLTLPAPPAGSLFALSTVRLIL